MIKKKLRRLPDLFIFLGITVSIAFFNFAGLSVTQQMSSTTRMVLDSTRTIVIWAFSLAVQWQTFHPLQVKIIKFEMIELTW